MDTPVTEPPPPEPHEPPADPGPTGPQADPQASSPGPSLGDWFSSLYRSSSDRLLGGVAGGLAERFAVPTVVVRIGFVLVMFLGIGFPLYVLAWALLPNDQGRRVMGHGPVRDLLAVGAVVVAGLMLFAEFDSVDYGSLLWRALPWFVLLGGLALLLRRSDGEGRTPPVPPVAPPPFPASEPNPFSVSDVPPPPPGYQYVSGVGAPVVTAPRPLPTPRPPRAPRPRPVVGPLTWCVAFLALGVMAIMAADDATSIGPGAMGAVLMIVFGIGLAFSAFRGRARGLLLPALALGAALGGLAAVDVRADTVARPFDVRVSSAGTLRDEYVASVGSSTLDLATLRLDGDTTVHVRQTAGHLTVILPRTVRVRGSVDLAAGETTVARVSGRSALYSDALTSEWREDGLPRAGDPVSDTGLRLLRASEIAPFWSDTEPDEARFTTGPDDGPVLRLDVEMGVGSVEVIDPRWGDLPERLVEPEQLCTVGGGPRGVVEPCSEVPEADRVALCINESSFLVDCREDRPATADWPRSAACRDIEDQQVPCEYVGIEPVGAQLISPFDPAVDEGVESEIRTGPTIAPPDPTEPPSTTSAPSTIAPPETVPAPGA